MLRIMSVFLFREIVKGQKRRNIRPLRKHGKKAGVAESNVAEISFAVGAAQKLCHRKTVRHRDIPRFSEFFGQNVYLPALAVVHRLLSDGKDRIVLSLCLALQQLKQIGVVAPGQSPVAGDNDITPFRAVTCFGIRGCKVRIAGGNIRQRVVECLEIRAA